MTQLSENFTLEELTRSQTASRRDIDNEPHEAAVAELKRLCEAVLQPLRDSVGAPIIVSSGFRCVILNTTIGGSRNSDHLEGRAADIKAVGASVMELANLIDDIDLPVKQCILEFDRWVHVSIEESGIDPRREFLTATRLEGATRYVNGLMSGEGAKRVLFG